MDNKMGMGYGGEVAKAIKKAREKEYSCKCGWKGIVDIFGYSHDGGYSDNEGKKWWLYFICPKCKSEITIDHISRQFKED